MSHCRSCGASLAEPCIDLGLSPVSNHLVKPEQLSTPDPMYPLQVRFCESCYLAQIDDPASREAHFSDDYVYFSSISSTWLQHAKTYAQQMMARLSLNEQSFVVEIASNDGYLLRNFVNAGIPCLGIEPTLSTAKAAKEFGVDSWTEFFGEQLANKIRAEKGPAHLIAANNVLAHVPDLNDFVAGIKSLLDSNGTATIEFPHLLSLVENRLFDTIYHEHYCYLSLLSAQALLERHQLQISDVELLSTHGGSYRLFVTHKGTTIKPDAVLRMEAERARERAAGLDEPARIKGFSAQLAEVKGAFNTWLNSVLEQGSCVIGYGAAAKATTFLNYCEIDRAQIPVILDAAPSKQGRYIPGCRIPIESPEKLKELKPDYVVIFPWNIQQEIMSDLAFIKEWGGQFVVALPKLQVSTA